MAEFSIETTDAAYSYDVEESVQARTARQTFEVENNNVKSNTQGFLRKIQVGDKRVKARVILSDSKTRIENNLYPMLTHPTNVTCTFERNIPLQTDSTGDFVIEDIRLLREFDNGVNIEVEIFLTEVINA